MAACRPCLQVLLVCACLASTGFSLRLSERHGSRSGEHHVQFHLISQPGARSCRADLQVGNAHESFNEKTTLGDACPEMFQDRKAMALRQLQPVRQQEPAPEALPEGESLSECPVFYLHAKNYAAQSESRDNNVESMMKMDKEIHAMEPIYWKTHAQLMYDAYAKLQLPVCTYVKDLKFGKCSGTQSAGQLGRWLSQIVTAAYQVRFGLKCMVTMEDDISLPSEFREHLSHYALQQDKPRLWRMSTWGEGVVLNQAGAREYIERLYRHGIFLESDQYIHHFLKDMDSEISVGINRLVDANGGSIAGSNYPGADHFDYESSVSSKPMEKLMSTFNSEDDLSMIDVLTRFTQS